MADLWYRLKQLPDLTLNKYSSLEECGVDGVLEKHVAFLRQLNRRGIVSNLSFHLFYLYLSPNDKSKDTPGRRLQIFLMIRGQVEESSNLEALINSSPLSEFFELEKTFKNLNGEKVPANIDNVLLDRDIGPLYFKDCAILTKTETYLTPTVEGGEGYYLIRDWEMNEEGRLYSMCKMMEAINETALFRIDLYPVERSVTLRNSLKRPMTILRERQDNRNLSGGRDYDGKDVLKNYEDLLEKYETSPHFIANIMVFANGKEDAISILDAAGSEALSKGKYNIATFASNFGYLGMLDGEFDELDNLRENMVVKKGKPGLLVCNSETITKSLNYLPTLFSLEEITPFFRFPALYDGEIIQLPKETAPASVDKAGSLFLGKDKFGYDVNFPLSLLPKHAFVAGVPGSGKTNTMHHITSSLWKRPKEERIPFLVLEPAKQEYRALLNDPDMRDVYLFSPNADMSFPLHINPFEMPKGTLIAEHIRCLCSVFEGAFPLEPPMPFLLDTAIEAVYRENGWIPEHVYMGDEIDEETGKGRKLPSMSQLYKRLEEELATTKYSDEVRGNLESALQVRIGSLLRREMGDVFDVPKSSFTPEKWLEVPAVIELESMGKGPANFLTLMLCALIRETLKANPRFDGPCRHVIFIEEAHNLIGPESEEQTGADADPKIAATAFIVKMLAEVRALKEGIVIADQLPTVMAQEVLKNTGLKLGLRITSSDDRQLLGSTMAASSLQLEQMSTFAVGESLVFYEKLQRPFTFRVHEWFGEIKDKELKENKVSSKNDADLRMALRIDKNEAYQEVNLTSIDIISKKYYQKFETIKNNSNNIVYWLQSILNGATKIHELKDYLYKNQKGEISISQDECDLLNDQLFALEGAYGEAIKNKESIKNCTDLIGQLDDMVFSLERMKNGRWTRFGAPEKNLVKISLLEAAMCDEFIRLYELAASALTQVKENSKLKRDAGKLSELSKELNEEVASYISLYGADSLA